MKSYRLLIILLAGVLIIVVSVFVMTLTDDQDSAPSPTESGEPARPTERESPDRTTSPAHPLPPTTDLFGNRLEVPQVESGVALTQDPATRPEPGRGDYLTAAPARMQWQRGWGGAALPVSGSDGPTRIDDGIASGFANTPQGAALAACDALARALTAPEGVWQQVVRDRYYGGGQPLLDRFARSRAHSPEAARYVVVPEGIRIHSGYKDDFAVVQLAGRGAEGYAISTWPMAWIEGDWRVRVGDDIDKLWVPEGSAPSLSGFGLWRNTL